MDTATLRRNLRRSEAVTRRLKAPVDLLAFAQITHPDPTDPEGLATRYEIAPPHRILAEHLEMLFNGEIKKLAIALPPRTGKSELGARKFIAWWLGRRPTDHIAYATYNDEFSNDMARDVRSVMQQEAYKEVFPSVSLDPASQSADRLGVLQGGRAVFVGRKGALTGRGMNLGIVDDLYKDDEEAGSPAIRDQAWRFFLRTFLTRRMDSDSPILLIGTRWHEDDVQGRLTDPRNQHYNADEAAEWTVLRVPAISEDAETDPLKRPRGEALWPKRFPAAFLNSIRNTDPQGFSALYQGKPTPEEGSHFRRDMLKSYRPADLPDVSRLRFYAASDHAISEKQRADKTCLIPAAVDDNDNLFILPDVVWRRMGADAQVAAIIAVMKARNPVFWWAEHGQITQTILPVLRKEMARTQTYCAIDTVTATKDKRSRSQAIHARTAMGKVLFPTWTPWWSDAQHELLTFPGGPHDDFVDAFSLLGIKLGLLQRGAAPPAAPSVTGELSLRWVKESGRQSARDKMRRRVRENWG